MVFDFKSQGNSALHNWNEAQLSEFIRAANQAYYQKHIPLLSDNEYDVLCDYTLERFPQNTAAQEGHQQTHM